MLDVTLTDALRECECGEYETNHEGGTGYCHFNVAPKDQPLRTTDICQPGRVVGGGSRSDGREVRGGTGRGASDMTTLTDAQLAAIEAREKAATPGPWFEYHTMDSGDWTVQVARGWVFVASDKGTGEDAAFVAHARTDVPTLIAALRACREALRLARVVVETLSEQPSYRSAATDGVLIEINAALGEEAPHV